MEALLDVLRFPGANVAPGLIKDPFVIRQANRLARLWSKQLPQERVLVIDLCVGELIVRATSSVPNE